MNDDSIESALQKINDHVSLLEMQELKDQLASYVNYLLLNDFNKLIQLLYRVDVDEQKLKQLLRDNQQTDAAVLIADLLIARQMQKAKPPAPKGECTDLWDK